MAKACLSLSAGPSGVSFSASGFGKNSEILSLSFDKIALRYCSSVPLTNLTEVMQLIEKKGKGKWKEGEDWRERQAELSHHLCFVRKTDYHSQPTLKTLYPQILGCVRFVFSSQQQSY